MKQPKCPVCGGEVDPERIAETCRKENVDGLMVLEISPDTKLLMNKAKAVIEDVMDVREALECVKRETRYLKMLVVYISMWGLVSFLIGEWPIGLCCFIFVSGLALGTRKIRLRAQSAADRFDENVAFVSQLSQPHEGDAELN